jgi:hypothetical protein
MARILAVIIISILIIGCSGNSEKAALQMTAKEGSSAIAPIEISQSNCAQLAVTFPDGSTQYLYSDSSSIFIAEPDSGTYIIGIIIPPTATLDGAANIRIDGTEMTVPFKLGSLPPSDITYYNYRFHFKVIDHRQEKNMK